MIIFKIFGIIGLLLICVGVLLKKRNLEDKFYIVGGLFLISYSIYIQDFIFITLQAVFTLSATYDLIRHFKK